MILGHPIFAFLSSAVSLLNEFRSGEKVSKTLEINDIILNMSMLPHEPLRNHDRPEGIRIGVQEMTRFGMGEPASFRIQNATIDVCSRTASPSDAARVWMNIPDVTPKADIMPPTLPSLTPRERT
jgi:glycine/serine hydroxymethyltransferase